MRFPAPAPLFFILSSPFLAANVQASAQSAGHVNTAKAAQLNPTKKRISIHLESYADAKSAATAQEIAALLEERLAKRSTHLRPAEYKNPAKAVSPKEVAKSATH